MRTIKQFLLATCGLASIAAFVVHADSAAALEKIIAAIKVGGPTSPDGQTEVTCDLPVSDRKQNIASRGLGCCVFRSMDHAARWQGVPQLVGFPEWMVQKGIPGGGYPAKVKELIERISKDRGMDAPGYLQYEGKNLSILREAIASGHAGRDLQRPRSAPTPAPSPTWSISFTWTTGEPASSTTTSSAPTSWSG